jgi:hypothetical protein
VYILVCVCVCVGGWTMGCGCPFCCDAPEAALYYMIDALNVMIHWHI